jgi:DNA-binding transcriptional MocR family regulator
MDSTILGYILTKQDRTHELLQELRLTLQSHGELLSRILMEQTGMAAEKDPKAGFFRWLKLTPFSQMIVGGVVSWGVGTAISSYLKHGGDPMALIAALLKSL